MNSNRTGKPKLFIEGNEWVISQKERARFTVSPKNKKSCKTVNGFKTKWGHVQVRLSVNEKFTSTYASRVSWFVNRGPIPNGMFVCHCCPGGDNPACINPNHLYLGTPADNVRDCETRGNVYHPAGEKHGRALLTIEQVREIRRTWKPRNKDFSGVALALKFGVSYSAVRHVITGKNWPDA